ncbi:PQQ-binding-like beta-propeller repeat protein [Brevundimonas sp. SL130]|uniref:outer membrane protein assembly factor BamB family protein n=1 Tax=Brevundimonas sp. SL130 TaxID=2995143 RepID=UPI00226C7112|nr:PQQ-binding-like beta-propeller repeat protein [Brevundimonas sp. SL130]WAC61379.1 PQQ-binding-like beta-propeller repeat protein [Brevundimonas sp. SL130]
MPQFLDTLVANPWALRTANGAYLGYDPAQVDPTGAPYAITVPGRATAAFLVFGPGASVTPTNVLTTIRTASGQLSLAVNSAGALVFQPTAGAGASFNILLVRSTQIQIGQNVTSTGGSFISLDPALNRFSLVSGASGGNARLGLAQSLPTGAVLWSSSQGQASVGTPYVYSGAVFSAQASRLLTCADQLSSAILWEMGEGQAATSPVEVNYAHRKAYVGDANGGLHAVDLDTGTPSWTFAASAPVYARPSAYVERVFVPSSDGVLYALSSDTGAQLWRYPAAGDLSGLFSSPVVAGATVYFGAWDQQLHAVDAATGAQVWTYAASNKISGGVETDGANVYFGTDSNEVVALRQSDGALIWQYSTNGIVSGAPLQQNGYIYFGSVAGDFACVSASTGVAVWSVNVGAPIASTAQFADGVIYFNTTTGRLYALQAGTGATLAHYDAGAPASGSVIVLSGVAYLAAGDQISALTAELSQGYVPLDSLALLMLSSWTNANNGQAPSFSGLPSGWTNLLAAASNQINTFATVGVTNVTLPGSDQAAVAVTFGVDPNAYMTYIDTTTEGLVPLPATIGGPNAPPGLHVNATVLASYLAVRSQVLTAVAQSGRPMVQVAGLGGGGALAALAALDLGLTAGKPGMPTVSQVCWTGFGAPSFGDAGTAAFFAQTISAARALQNVDDAMPGLLPAALGYAPVGKPMTIGAAGVTTSPSIDPGSFKAYRTSLVGR